MYNLNCFIIRRSIQRASLGKGFVIASLSSVWLYEPSSENEGCYLFCHAHTSTAHGEEVSMQGTWLIEGTGHRGELCTAMAACEY